MLRICYTCNYIVIINPVIQSTCFQNTGGKVVNIHFMNANVIINKDMLVYGEIIIVFCSIIPLLLSGHVKCARAIKL